MGGSSEIVRAEAKALADLGAFDQAREALARAIDADSGDSALHAMMAWVTASCRKVDPHERERLSQHHLSVSFELSPDNGDAHYHQGRILAEQGNAARARVSLEQALKVNPRLAAARTLLDKLDGGGAPAAAAVSMIIRPGARRVVRGPLIALGVLALLVAGAGYYVLTADQREAARLAEQLGTTLALQSIQRNADHLIIDVGSSWGAMGAPERTAEVRKIAEGAARLGFTEVFIYALSQPVAEIHGPRICADPSCLSIPVQDGNTLTIQRPTAR